MESKLQLKSLEIFSKHSPIWALGKDSAKELLDQYMESDDLFCEYMKGEIPLNFEESKLKSFFDTKEDENKYKNYTKISELNDLERKYNIPELAEYLRSYNPNDAIIYLVMHNNTDHMSDKLKKRMNIKTAARLDNLPYFKWMDTIVDWSYDAKTIFDIIIKFRSYNIAKWIIENRLDSTTPGNGEYDNIVNAGWPDIIDTLYEKKKIRENIIIESARLHSNCELLELLRDRFPHLTYAIDTAIIYSAVENNDLTRVKSYEDQITGNPLIIDRISELASNRGKLDILKWVYEKFGHIHDETCKTAFSSMNNKILDWLDGLEDCPCAREFH